MVPLVDIVTIGKLYWQAILMDDIVTILEKEMATHSSVLTWRIPGTGEPGQTAVYGVAESDTTEVTQHSNYLKIFMRLPYKTVFVPFI